MKPPTQNKKIYAKEIRVPLITAYIEKILPQ